MEAIIAGARVGKYNLGTRAGKCKVSLRVGKRKLGARVGKYKLGARARAGGQGLVAPWCSGHHYCTTLFN